MKDDYRTAKGFLSLPEREHLKSLAQSLADRFSQDGAITCVNIGVEYGASLQCLRAGAPEAWIIGVDLDCTKRVGSYDLQRTFFVTGDSYDIGKSWRAWATAHGLSPAVHLVFVDGGHDTNTVTRDIAAWSGYVVPGGLLVFHDYSSAPHHAGVVEAIDSWKTRSRRWTELPPVETLRVFERQEPRRQKAQDANDTSSVR